MTANDMKTTVQTENFICPNCGGVLRHDIKKDKFLCGSCGYEGELQAVVENVREYDFGDYVRRELESVPFIGEAVAECQNCGSTVTFGEFETATTCPMCGSTQISIAKQKTGIPPEGIIPFKVDRQEAGQKFRMWVKKLWFAPNKLKTSVQEGSLKGKFVPFWTYDTDAFATYTGEGGKHRRVKDKDGKEHTVTDWYSTSGVVEQSFDDILVCASKGESARDADDVGPFNTIGDLRPYALEYLSGYQAEVYSIKADEGFETAKQRIEPELEHLADLEIRHRFDTSRSVRIFPKYTNVTYKHVLLPVWSSLFGYSGKTYRYVVNGATGKVHGQRPYSAVKIVVAVVIALAVIIGAYLLFTRDARIEKALASAGIATAQQQINTVNLSNKNMKRSVYLWHGLDRAKTQSNGKSSEMMYSFISGQEMRLKRVQN